VLAGERTPATAAPPNNQDHENRGEASVCPHSAGAAVIESAKIKKLEQGRIIVKMMSANIRMKI
jgi:hypothetical protein